jgi:hypothetical protein
MKTTSSHSASLFALTAAAANPPVAEWSAPVKRSVFFQSSAALADVRLWLVSDLPSADHARLAASFNLSHFSASF